MKPWLFFGLILGSLAGLGLVMFFLLWIRPVMPLAAPQPAVPAADVNLFLSERSLSRAASTALDRPTTIDCQPGGRLQITTQAPIGGLEPVVQLGLTLQQQGAEVSSQLHWAQLGFLRLPIDWFPPEILAAGSLPGQTITEQIPPDFTLAGLTTTAEGITVQLNWTGR